MDPCLLFSSMEYYRNKKFQKMLLRWNTYMESDEDNAELLSTWEELLLQDFRIYANEWLKGNKNKTGWRKDLI